MRLDTFVRFPVPGPVARSAEPESGRIGSLFLRRRPNPLSVVTTPSDSARSIRVVLRSSGKVVCVTVFDFAGRPVGLPGSFRLELKLKKVAIGTQLLNVVDEGAGTVLLLIHGFPLDHSMWRPQIDDLSSDFRVIAPDLRGFGTSSTVEPSVSMQRLADDLANLLEALDIDDPVSLGGLSMGGYVAWEFWRRHPRRLKHLILCDTRAEADDHKTRQTRVATAKRVLREGSALLAKMMIPRLFATETLQTGAPAVDATRQVILRTHPATIAAALHGMANRRDASTWLPDIDIPTLLLCGASDVITPAREMQRLAAALPSSHYVTIPHAGHLAPLENPVAVNQEIRRFLDR